jgi:hypothetical protein
MGIWNLKIKNQRNVTIPNSIIIVHLKGLAAVSTYFNNFFFAFWREKGQEEFVIHEEEDPDFDIDSFKLMIYGALSLSWMVPELLQLFKGISCREWDEFA